MCAAGPGIGRTSGFIYAKGKRGDIPVREIRGAFAEAGIRPESGDASLP